jgi:hypothetical protein
MRCTQSWKYVKLAYWDFLSKSHPREGAVHEAGRQDGDNSGVMLFKSPTKPSIFIVWLGCVCDEMVNSLWALQVGLKGSA